MTKIFLMRHAKAVRPAPNLEDFDRALEPSGRADAAAMGRRLVEAWGLPDHAICSGAARTRQTLAELGVPAERVRFSDELFDGDGADYVRAIRSSEGGAVLLVGHNPSVQDAALMLAGSGDAALREALVRKFPTSGVAVLSTDRAPGELGPGCCTLEAFLTPDDALSA